MKLWMTGVVAAVFALALFALPGSGAMTVYAVPTGDYCGNNVIDVPDSGTYFNFGGISGPCALHDQCYAAGGTESDRKACDDAFLSNMLDSCSAMWQYQPFKRVICDSVAYTYYTGVRIGGWAFFDYGGQV